MCSSDLVADVHLSGGTATFSDSAVANGKTVTITGLTLTGADAGNYSLKVTAVADNCVSDAVPVTIGTNFTFPPVVTAKLSAQNSCDPAVVLGRVGATVGGVLTDHTFVWRKGANFNTGTALTVTGTETLPSTGEIFFFADKIGRAHV